MVIALIGAGGKTTLLKRCAKEYLSQGLNVFVTTTTHMFLEEDTLLSDDADTIIQRLKETHYVMAGVQAGQKISALSEETRKKVSRYADVTLIEADGSKHFPLKFPNNMEPVIPEDADEIIVVCGLHAIGQKAKDAVHRLELAKQHMDITDETIIDERYIKELLWKGYLEPLHEKYPDKKLRVHANCDLVPQYKAIAEQFGTEERMRKQVGCVIMASGLGVRFGGNKLIAEFHGKTLIEWVLELTGCNLFAKRVVVTRSREVETICKRVHADVIFHELPDRNDTVRLGTESMKEMDGCVFCPCDQPLLTRESLENLIAAFQMGQEGIFRLAYGEREGTPVLFDKRYFEELCGLLEKKGGSHLIKRYPEDVKRVQTITEYELYDVDRVKDIEFLEGIYESQTK